MKLAFSPSFSRTPSLPSFQPASSSILRAPSGSSPGCSATVAGSKSLVFGLSSALAGSPAPKNTAWAIGARSTAMFTARRMTGSLTTGLSILKPMKLSQKYTGCCVSFTLGIRRSPSSAKSGISCVTSACPVWIAARRVVASGMTRKITRSTWGAGFL